MTPEGPQMREIRLGMSNEKMVEVKEGLEEGDKVVLNPVLLLSAKERMEYGNLPARSSQDGKGKGGPGGKGKGKGGKDKGGMPEGAAPGGGMPGAPRQGGARPGGGAGGGGPAAGGR
jgi:hypothetical protein